MKRNVLVGCVVVAAIVAIVAWRRCGNTNHTRTASSSTGKTTGSGATRSTPRDQHVDPRTLRRSTISGTITDAVTKSPLAGARVCGDGSSPALSSQIAREPTCATTDASGAYVLKDLIAATYTIGASAKTYRPATYHPGGDYRRDEIALAAGETKTAIDLALRPGGVEITGTVSDITGGPVGAALVRDTDGPWPPVETDAAGKYTLWVSPGGTTIQATAEGYAPGSESGRAPGTFDILLTPESSLAGTVVDAASNEPIAGAQVTVREQGGGLDGAGELTDVTDDQGAWHINRIPPGRYTEFARTPHGQGRGDGSTLVGLGQHVDGVVIRLHPGVQITGTVMHPDKTPCLTADVFLSDTKQDRNARTRTEPDGSVHADGVLPGTYEVEVVCTDSIPHDAYPPITVADHDVTGQVWDVDAGATIRGHVVTKTGEPLPDVWVLARAIDNGTRKRQGWANGRTNLDGSYAILGLRAGKEVLEVSTNKGIGPPDGWPVEVAERGTLDKELVLDAAGSMTGTVVDTAGKPVAAVGVRANQIGGRASGVYGNGNGKTATDGTFTLDGLTPGEYRVSAERARAGTLRKPGSTDDSTQGERVTVTAGKRATVKLVVEAQTGTISGSVLATNGTPSAEAYVTAARESDAAGSQQSAVSATRWDRKPVITAVDGTFTVGDLSPGLYTVRAYIRGGGEAYAEHVPVGAVGTKLQLKPTGSISGTVTAPGGDLEELWIELRAPALGFIRKESFFRSHGVFTMRDLPAGTFTLTASGATGKKQLDLELGEGETKAGVAITLDAFITITGRVVDSVTKQPVAGIRMSAGLAKDGSMQMRGGASDKNTTGEDGRFELEKSPTGSVVLRGWPKDYQFSDYNGVATIRDISGTGTVDVGDLVALKRRVKNGEKAGLLGVTFADDPPGTPVDKRIYKVSFIEPAGPAAKSGIVVGDIMVAVDGNNVTGADALNAWMFLLAPPGTKIVLGLKRGATVTIVLAAP